MTEQKQKKLLSIRGKLIGTLAIVVVFVSFIIIYFTSNMVIKDKKAYLYDTAFLNLKTISQLFENFTNNKDILVDAYLSADDIASDLSRKKFSQDKDLFQVSSFSVDDFGKEDFLSKSFLTNRDKEKIDNFSVEQYLNHKSNEFAFFTNLIFFDRYKKRKSFLLAPSEFIKENAKKTFDEMKKRSFIYFNEGMAPRYFVFVYDEKKSRVYCFDFLMDYIVEGFLGASSFENFLINEEGKIVFQNKPQLLTPSHLRFFKRFLGQLKNSKSDKESLGVREKEVGNENYIMGFKRIKKFPNYYIFTGIRTSDAYAVTTKLILNTIIFALVLIGLFNVIAIFLARTITGPIDRFISVIQTIATGKYDARVDDQSTSELQTMALTFNSMVEKIQEYNLKLIEYNRTLEQKVLERTEKLREANDFIKTMVDSLAQGLLVFDRSGHCLDLFTKACKKILGMEPANKKLKEILRPDDEAIFNDWVSNLFEEMIPFDSLAELGPKFIEPISDFKDKKFKHVTLEYFPMRNNEGKIENVVLVATDNTKEFKAQKQILEEQNFVKLISKVVKDKKMFNRFVEMFESSLKYELNHAKIKGEINKIDFMRLLHSLKGSAAFYSFQEIVDKLHEFETDVSEDKLNLNLIIDRSNKILEILEKEITRLREFLGQSKEESADISEKKLRSFYKSLLKVSPQAADSFLNEFLYGPALKYVEQYKSLVSELAQKLGKSIKPLEIQNGILPVDITYYQPFFDSCIHLFRNSVDHGIESPDTRTAAGKTPEGSIIATFVNELTDEGQWLIFQLQDDGAGIDPNRIRKKMLELGYSEEEIQENDEKIIYHIFDSSFSTAERLTDISGRGVGLFDIKENIIKIGGSFEVKSELGRGTIFSFKLPPPSYFT